MRYPKWVRIIGLVALGALLSACSAVRLTYNNLPTLSYFWLDGYVDFSAAQSTQVKEELVQLLAWHRQNELPKIAELIQQAALAAPHDITPAQACAFTDQIRLRLIAASERAEVPGAALALSLDVSQIQYLERKYAKNNANYADDWLDRSREQQQDKRYAQYLDRNEDFYGRLDDEQRRLLRQLVSQSLFDPKQVDVERRRRQKDALTVLRGLAAGGATPGQARAALHAYVQRISEPPPGPRRDYQRALLLEGCQNVAALHNSTTVAQRQKAVQRLQAYQADVRSLMAGP